MDHTTEFQPATVGEICTPLGVLSCKMEPAGNYPAFYIDLRLPDGTSTMLSSVEYDASNGWIAGFQYGFVDSDSPTATMNIDESNLYYYDVVFSVYGNQDCRIGSSLVIGGFETLEEAMRYARRKETDKATFHMHSENHRGVFEIEKHSFNGALVEIIGETEEEFA